MLVPFHQNLHIHALQLDSVEQRHGCFHTKRCVVAGEELLRNVYTAWKHHLVVVRWGRFQFRYLDEYYTKNQNICSLRIMMLKCFQTAVVCLLLLQSESIACALTTVCCDYVLEHSFISISDFHVVRSCLCVAGSIESETVTKQSTVCTTTQVRCINASSLSINSLSSGIAMGVCEVLTNAPPPEKSSTCGAGNRAAGIWHNSLGSVTNTPCAFQYEKIKHDLCQVLLAEVQRERDGIEINRTYMQLVIQVSSAICR